MSNPEEQPLETYTLNNDHLEVIVSKLPHCLIKLNITVSPEGVQAAYKNAIKNIKKEVSLPGFRKGKAPDNFILEQYPLQIKDEWRNIVAKTAINEAAKLSELYPLNQELIDPPKLTECDMEKGAKIECSFEIYPSIPTIDLKSIELPEVPLSEITEDQLKEKLDDYAFSHATFENIEDRGVKENDMVNLSITLLKTPPVELVKHQKVEISKKQVPLWAYEKIIGLKPSESAEGMTALDLNFDQPNDDFKSEPFQVTIHSIEKPQLPAIDDELAKKSGLENLEDLKNKLKNVLENNAKLNQEQALEVSLMHFLNDNYAFDVPESFYSKYKNELIKSKKQQMQKNKVSDLDQMMTEYENQIDHDLSRQCQLYLILKKCSEENDIKITEEDITKEVSLQFQLAQSGKSSVDFSSPKEEVFEQLNRIALDRKTKEFLIKHTKTS
ncbi:MAG: trigger factor [Parachlamydiaceae bacterium]|nr:trigger factor [Parachlamydiaceae bacterium]